MMKGIQSVWQHIINLGIDSTMTMSRRRSIQNFNTICVICSPFPFLISLLLYRYAGGNYNTLALGGWATAGYLLMPVISGMGKFATGRLVMYLTIVFFLVYNAFTIGEGYGLEFPFFVMLCGAFSFSDSASQIKKYASVTSACLVACIVIYHLSADPVDAPRFTIHIIFTVCSLFLSFLCLNVLRLQREGHESAIMKSKFELEQQKAELVLQHENLNKLNAAIKEKNEKLGLKNFLITESLNYAKRIQLSTLPSPDKLRALMQDYFLFFRPKDIVSGDFYWADRRDGMLYFAVADCTGHGVAGAFMSLMGTNTLNQIFGEKEKTAPADILRELDNRITLQLGSDLPDNVVREGMDIVLCRIDLATDTMRFASAGRPLYFLRDGLLQEIKGSRVYIGKNYREDEHLVEHEIQLKDNDTIYLFSDGITDQFDVADKKRFGTGRLRKLLPEISFVDMDGQAELLRKEFESWKGHVVQTDDVLLLGYRYKKHRKKI